MIGETKAKFSKKDTRDHYHLPHIPEEIITKILLKLPVESLLRCRSVSKHWLSLISNPRFTQAHLDLAKTSTSLHRQRHIVFQNYLSLQIRSIDFHSLDLVNHSCPVLDSQGNAEVLASCDGLLLVGVGYTDHFLWNPSTRVYKKVLGGYYLFRGLLRLYGLGYDSSTDTYKVIRVVRVRVKEIDHDATHVRVYNCTTQVWRQIEDFPYEVFTNGQGVVVNGAPHWVVSRQPCWIEKRDGPHLIRTRDTTVRELVIIWFDLAEERFREVANPDWLVEGCKFDFGSLRGSICLARHEVSETEVWIMEKYGVRESWTRLFNVPTAHVDKFMPLCLREHDNEVLMEIRKHKLTAYNRSNGNVDEILRFSSPANRIVFKSAPYMESLVSPPGED